jgi:hypothetical protein
VIEIDEQVFIDVCEDEGISAQTRYGGRGMYGRHCVGIVGSTKDLMKFAMICIEAIERVRLNTPADEPATIDSDWFDVRQDSMGYDTIFYWPSVRIA